MSEQIVEEIRSYMTCTLLCAQATDYDVKLTFVDPDGVMEREHLTMTRLEVSFTKKATV